MKTRDVVSLVILAVVVWWVWDTFGRTGSRLVRGTIGGPVGGWKVPTGGITA